jgi:hypothetical protein
MYLDGASHPSRCIRRHEAYIGIKTSGVSGGGASGPTAKDIGGATVPLKSIASSGIQARTHGRFVHAKV